MTLGPEAARPAVYLWSAPAGREPAPPPLEDAERAFAGALEAYERGDGAAAAEAFLAAAALVPAEASGPYAASLGGMREMAYRNAALAWSTARTPRAGRRALAAAADRDPTYAALLHELAAGL
jgi:hypothetical protein